MNRSTAYDLLARVEDELDAAQFALSYVLRGIDVDANFAQAAIVEGVTGNELKRCAENLEITFVLRLFWNLREFCGIIGGWVLEELPARICIRLWKASRTVAI
jgi:hypothetical protein